MKCEFAGRLAPFKNEHKILLIKAASEIVTGSSPVNLLGDLLSITPPEDNYEPHPAKEFMLRREAQVRKNLGKKISPMAYACYSTQEEYEQSMSMVW